MIEYIFMGAVLLFYFLPAIIAYDNHKRGAWAILAINFLLGWSVIGWIVALILAIVEKEKE